MSDTYYFYEPGTVPGVPGTFAGKRVDVSDTGEITVSPLDRHLAFVEATSEEPSVPQPEAETEQPVSPQEAPDPSLSPAPSQEEVASPTTEESQGI